MKKTYLKIGKIVGSHGIKGMVRIECWCDSPDFLCKFKRFFFAQDVNTAIGVEKVTPHKNIALAKLSGVNTIEEAEALRGKMLYIYRDDIKLEKGRYFIEEIIGTKVLDKQTENFYGIISDINSTGANDIWVISNEGKEFLFPSVPAFVDSVDIEKEVAYINPPKGIFEDED